MPNNERDVLMNRLRVDPPGPSDDAERREAVEKALWQADAVQRSHDNYPPRQTNLCLAALNVIEAFAREREVAALSLVTTLIGKRMDKLATEGTATAANRFIGPIYDEVDALIEARRK